METRLKKINERLVQRGARMSPRLEEQLLVDFENRAGVRLPDEFRDFLLSIGNGGDGPPHFGLNPLGTPLKERDESWHSSVPLAMLARDFPFQEAVFWADDAGPEEWEHYSLQATSGTLELGTDGCGLYWLLVVAGPQRGKVWQLGEMGILPCNPPLGFLDWLECWLDGRTDWWSLESNPA